MFKLRTRLSAALSKLAVRAIALFLCGCAVAAPVDTASHPKEEYIYGERAPHWRNSLNILAEIGWIGGRRATDSSGRSDPVPNEPLDSTAMCGWKRGDRVGVFSPAQSIYFTARLKAFSLGYYESAGDFIVYAEFEPISRDPIFSADSAWDDYQLILWNPWKGVDSSLRQFDPQSYDGVYHFNFPAGEHFKDYAPTYDAKEKLNIELRKRELPEVPYMLDPIAQECAPCSPGQHLDYTRVIAPFVTDSTYGYHEIIIMTSGNERAKGFCDYDSMQIVAIVTNTDRLKQGEYNRSEYRWVEEIHICGVVDLDFDGVYELVVLEQRGDTTIYSGSTYLVKLIDGIPTQSAPWKSEGGC